MRVIETIEGLRESRAAMPGRVGLVTTMGALHEGHIALVRAAREENDAVIVTIFVNPTQFAPGEDFEKYPRDLPRDLKMLENAGVDVVFTPTPALMYPPGFQTTVTVEKVTQQFEGALRPGHFQGVATVVAKLFNLTQPRVAYFGQKDAQQVVTLRRMVRDLNFPLEIAVCPTVREADGLAMSSRNVYLSAEQRARSVTLYQGIEAAWNAYEAGERDPERLRKAVHSMIDGVQGVEPDYIEVVDPVTLEPVTVASDEPLLLLITARLGKTRLLDNALLPRHLNDRAGLSATMGV